MNSSLTDNYGIWNRVCQQFSYIYKLIKLNHQKLRIRYVLLKKFLQAGRSTIILIQFKMMVIKFSGFTKLWPFHELSWKDFISIGSRSYIVYV